MLDRRLAGSREIGTKIGLLACRSFFDPADMVHLNNAGSELQGALMAHAARKRPPLLQSFCL